MIESLCVSYFIGNASEARYFPLQSISQGWGFPNSLPAHPASASCWGGQTTPWAGRDTQGFCVCFTAESQGSALGRVTWLGESLIESFL